MDSRSVEIENRLHELEDKDKKPFFMVDLVIDGETINTGSNPISSYSFWEEMEDQAQRAIYRIKNNNKMKFDFNLATMGLSEEQKEQRFRDHIKSKHPEFDDVDRLFELVDEEVGKITMSGPDDNHPNPYLKFPIGSQMTKNFILCVIENYLKEKSEVES